MTALTTTLPHHSMAPMMNNHSSCYVSSSSSSSSNNMINNINNNNIKWEGDEIGEFDPRNNEHVEAMVEHVKSKLMQRLETIQSDFETYKGKVDQAHAYHMSKVPTNIKKMKLSEFAALYKTDLKEILVTLAAAHQQQKSNSSKRAPFSGSMSSCMTTCKKRDFSATAAALETPAPGRAGGGGASTIFASRRIQTPSMSCRPGGEDEFLVATIVKKARGGVSRTAGAPGQSDDAELASEIGLNVNGHYIPLHANLADMNCSEMDGLDPIVKNKALDQVKMLQNRLQVLQQFLDK